MKLYVIGSLRNPEVKDVANLIRDAMPEWEVFDDWIAAGPHADDEWRDYEKQRGRSYEQALAGYAARHVFEYDKHHLDTSDAVLLVAPAGKSGFLELGYCIGRGKPSAILLDSPDRWDVMFQFAGCVSEDLGKCVSWLGAPSQLPMPLPMPVREQRLAARELSEYRGEKFNCDRGCLQWCGERCA